MPQAFGSVLLKFIVAAAIQYGTAKLAQRQAQRNAKRDAMRRPISASYVGGVEPRRIALGHMKTGGVQMLPSVTTALNGQRVWRCEAIAGHEIESVEAVMFNNDEVPLASISGGLVVSGTYANKALVMIHLGLASQGADDLLQGSGIWTSYFRGDGIAYVGYCFIFDPTIYTSAPTTKVEWKGAIAYDPRLDLTPGADPTNPAYAAYTTNTALLLAYVLMLDFVLDEDATEIVWSDVVTAANACDEDVDIPGATTQKRFTFNGLLFAPENDQELNQLIADIAHAMLGTCYRSSAGWRMFAGVYSSPAFTLTDDDLAGDIEIPTTRSRKGGGYYNAVRGRHICADKDWQEVEYPEARSDAFETADGGERIYRPENFFYNTDAYEAQRNAIVILKQGRRQKSVRAAFKFSAFGILPFEIGTVTISSIGITALPMRCVDWNYRQDGVVELELVEVNSDDYADPDTTDYLVPGSISLPTPENYQPSAVTNFAATGAANGIIFTWTPPADAPAGLLYQLFEYTSSTPFGSATQLGSDTPQTSIVIPKTDTTTRYYWIRTKMPETGVTGAYSPPVNGLPGRASSASGGLSAIVFPGTATVTGAGTSLTTNTVSVTPAGGTAPYTYSTAFVSGGTDITINNGTTTAPSFSSTSAMALDETRSGTARITVQDNVAATFTVDVAVTITRSQGIVIADKALYDYFTGFGAAVCVYALNADGTITTAPTTTSDSWRGGTLTSSDYDVRVTATGSALDGGSSATGSWLQLNTDRSWTLTRGTAGVSTATLTVEIRLHASPFTVLDTATVTLTSEYA